MGIQFVVGASVMRHWTRGACAQPFVSRFRFQDSAPTSLQTSAVAWHLMLHGEQGQDENEAHTAPTICKAAPMRVRRMVPRCQAELIRLLAARGSDG